ncbi:hypothetical protein THUN1379_24440 [Paludibacterium sp. THUN1379]|uniref:hypothetical protein n=1 Tax=Paludibacterium sp. THUN1379 TaxID=3112107 RepID=UPI003092FB9D|nr:hypothetical protein THUN1379_24440 [Paludibacterium sp. THUN1379]
MKLHPLCFSLALSLLALHAQAASSAACLKPDALQSQMTPVELFPAAAACIQDNDLPSAVMLVGLGSAYASYDSQRVSDPTATSAGNVVQRAAMNTLSSEQKQQLGMAVVGTMRDQDKRTALCQSLQRIGAPTYTPTYMINHGQVAMSQALTHSTSTDSGLKPDFDGGRTWAMVLQNYMHCPAN